MPTSNEKRKFVRVRPLETEPVEVHLMGTTLLDILHASDISVGGIGILAPNHFSEWDLHEKIQILVALPGDLADFMARGVIKQVGKNQKRKEYTEFNLLKLDPKANRIYKSMLTE